MSKEPIKTLADAAVSVYMGNAGWMPQGLAELTKEELLTRPSKGRSHLWWIVGHLATSSDIGPMMNGSASVIPEEYKKLFDMETAPSDTGDGYPSMSELMEVFKKALDNSCAAIKALSDEQFNQKTGAELPEFLAQMSRFELVVGFGAHISYHIGQMVTILRKLDKKPWPDM
ncbi:MAG: DinB family protein [candidate division Zixibacteria bacterium]|nr:DinB family protein [candidate division Zixibacteria bacterium]